MSDASIHRERPKRLDTVECVYQTALLTLRRSLRGGRLVVTLLVVLFPLALSIPLGASVEPEEQEEFFYLMLSFYHFGIVVPAVALAMATAFPWPESDEGTLTYWFTAPVRRWTIHLGRWLAAWALGTVLLPLGVLAIAVPLETPPAAALNDVVLTTIGATLVAYPAYLALFWLFATWFRNGLVVGVVFALAEYFLSMVPANIVRVLLIYYVRSMVYAQIPTGSRSRAEDFAKFDTGGGGDGTDLAERLGLLFEPATPLTSVLTFACVTVVTLVLSLLVVEAVEYRSKTSQAA